MSEVLSGSSLSTGQDTISSAVQMLLVKNAVIAPQVLDVSAFAEQGSKSISFPRRTSNFTVQKLSGAVKGTDQELLISLDKLELTEEAHIQWAIKGFDTFRNKVNILQASIESAVATHAYSLDQDIYDALVASQGNTPVSGGVDQDAIADCVKSLDDVYVPRTNRFWLFSNAGYNKLLKIFDGPDSTNFNILSTGQIAQLFGYPVFVSNAFSSTYEAGLFHKEAIALGFGSSPRIEDESCIEFGTGSRRWVMDQNYGLKVLLNSKGHNFIAA
jgi:hypothetical protein